MSKTIQMKFDPHDYRGLIHAMDRMDVNAQNALRDDVMQISNWVAQGIIQKSYTAPFPKQTALVAATVRAKRDRMPFVEIGGARGTKASGGAAPGILLAGNEFGGPTRFPNGGRRFPWRTDKKGRGNKGYWIFPAVTEMQPEITHRWKSLVDRYVTREWSRG